MFLNVNRIQKHLDSELYKMYISTYIMSRWESYPEYVHKTEGGGPGEHVAAPCLVRPIDVRNLFVFVIVKWQKDV